MGVRMRVRWVAEMLREEIYIGGAPVVEADVERGSDTLRMHEWPRELGPQILPAWHPTSADEDGACDHKAYDLVADGEKEREVEVGVREDPLDVVAEPHVERQPANECEQELE